MGGEQFDVTEFGNTPGEAFTAARDKALYDHGHSGYSGTIAEKSTFRYLPPPITMSLGDALRYIDHGSMYPEDSKYFPENVKDWAVQAGRIYDDKWGPAVCLPVIGDEVIGTDDTSGRAATLYLFCGIASS